MPVAPPRGERGLKHGLIGDDEVFDYGRSPSWGAWIETAIARQSRGMKSSRSPSWGAWIETEMLKILRYDDDRRSPSWGAWIETS